MNNLKGLDITMRAIDKKLDLVQFNTLLIVLAIVGYGYRAKIGAVFLILFMIFCFLELLLRLRVKLSCLTLCWITFILIFSVFISVTKSITFIPYLFIGYIGLIFVMNTQLFSLKLFFCYFRIVALIQGIGVFLQFLLPSIYFEILQIIFNTNTYNDLVDRAAIGYAAGFTREVAFANLFIIIGIGNIIITLWNRKKNHIREYGLLLILFIALLFTGKRAQPMFCIIALLLTWLYANKNIVKLFKFMFFILTFFCTGILSKDIWGKIPSLSRFRTLIDNYTNGASIIALTNGRSELYNRAFRLWSTSKYWGIGWGNFKFTSTAKDSWSAFFDVHNCYIQLLCETGIVGLILFVLLATITLFFSIRLLRKSKDMKFSNRNYLYFACFYQIFFLLYSITGTCLYEFSYYAFYFISIAIIIQVRNEEDLQKIRYNSNLTIKSKDERIYV